MAILKRKWTNQEVDFLKKNYGKLTPQQCAKHLGRNKNSVKQKAIRLGVGGRRQSFSSEEISYIVSNYAQKGPIKLAKEMGRKRGAIHTVAHTHGLRMTKEARGRMTTAQNTGRKMSETTKGKIGSANRKHFKDNTCLDCGKKIVRRASRCRICNLKSRRGENHMWWNGGVSVLYQIVAHMLYPAWKYPILCRDNFTCQDCERHDQLEVHHLRLFVEIRDLVMKENPNFSIDNFKERKKLAALIVAEHELEDGVTLCHDCHKNCHREKLDELRETPNGNAEGNPQPSRLNVISLVSRKVQRPTDEDSQPISLTRASDPKGMRWSELAGDRKK